VSALSIKTAARNYARAKDRLAEARDELRRHVREVVGTGAMSEAEAARVAGVDRMTVRAWLGKS